MRKQVLRSLKLCFWPNCYRVEESIDKPVKQEKAVQTAHFHSVHVGHYIVFYIIRQESRYNNKSRADLRASLCKILTSSFAHEMDFAHNFSVDFFK